MSFITKDGRTIVRKSWKCATCSKDFYSASSSSHPTCSRKCKYSSPFFKRHGVANHQWKGGRTHDAYGYIIVSHPITGKPFKEHRMVMETSMGRELLPSEHVHHINGDKTDNRLENLELISPSEHLRRHANERHKTARLYGRS